MIERAAFLVLGAATGLLGYASCTADNEVSFAIGVVLMGIAGLSIGIAVGE